MSRTQKGLKIISYKAFDYIIPPVVVGFVLWAWYLCTFEIGLGYFYQLQGQYLFGGIYAIISTILLFVILLFYVDLATLPKSFDVPPELLEPPQYTPFYECKDKHGKFLRCQKAECNGRWKPPRTHHCSMCNECRVGFDHHCPWIGRCITLSVMKEFILLLAIIPPTLVTLSCPILPLLSSQASLALEESYNSSWAHWVWWEKWYSWIAVAGPPGRWIVGTVIGYWLLDAEQCDSLGCMLQNPHARVLLTVIFALILAIFSLGLGLATAWRIHRGETTVERARTRLGASTYIVINDIVLSASTTAVSTASSPSVSQVFPTSVETPEIKVMELLRYERPYDLGPSENWKQFWRLSLFVRRDGAVKKDVLGPRLNPKVLERMQL
ncbi:hypothetical protein M422DRAFT_63391 [Sphaerobolus stellatus SS14]|nr:hypothetical protein M422DRAFT_63391 [Sphaerobolus stellatus SS14]